MRCFNHGIPESSRRQPRLVRMHSGNREQHSPTPAKMRAHNLHTRDGERGQSCGQTIPQRLGRERGASAHFCDHARGQRFLPGPRCPERHRPPRHATAFRTCAYWRFSERGLAAHTISPYDDAVVTQDFDAFAGRPETRRDTVPFYRVSDKQIADAILPDDAAAM